MIFFSNYINKNYGKECNFNRDNNVFILLNRVEIRDKN